MHAATQELSVVGANGLPKQDRVAVEEPLEMRIGDRPLTITMRTPGDDEDLACGFLFSEGILKRPEDLASVTQLEPNIVRVMLAAGVPLPFDKQARSFTTTSSCGVCGKTSLEMLDFARPSSGTPDPLTVSAKVIHALPAALRRAQKTFETTGGLHASALFDGQGTLLSVYEDVGRHNALDKLIGHQLRAGRLPLRETVLLVSGRASFELVQKAAMAQIPVLAAVGAPSSLAVQLAAECKMTLVGFVRDERFNVYSGAQRIFGR